MTDTYKLILILLVLLLFVGFMAYYYLSNKSSNKSTDNPLVEYYNTINKNVVNNTIRGMEFGSNELAEEQRIQYIKHPEITSQFAKENTLPSDMFDKIARVEPHVPTKSDVENSFYQCIKGGNTFQACLTESGAGSQPQLCRSLCDENYGALNKVCSSICYNQIAQQNNSCRFGSC